MTDSPWIFLTQLQATELEDVVRRTGWSWLTVYDRVGSTMGEIQAVRQGKRPFAFSVWMPYLNQIADAVGAIEMPERPAPYVPEGSMPVMPPGSMAIDTIAQALGRLFLEAESFAPGERENSQDAYGRVAEALGIEADVANTIRGMQGNQPQQVQAVAPSRPIGVLRDAAA
jgi:hypothetical protein